MNDSGEDSSSDDLLVENNPDTGNKMQEKDSSTDKTPAITGDQKKQSCFSGKYIKKYLSTNKQNQPSYDNFYSNC